MGFQLTFRLLGCDRIRDRTFFSAGGRVFRLSSSWVTLIEFVVAIWNCEGVFASLFVEGEHVLKLKINLKTGQYCKYSKLFWVGNNICTGKSGEQFIEAQFDGDFLLGLVGGHREVVQHVGQGGLGLRSLCLRGVVFYELA